MRGFDARPCLSSPPHPARKSAPTSPPKRGEVEQAARAGAEEPHRGEQGFAGLDRRRRGGRRAQGDPRRRAQEEIGGIVDIYQRRMGNPAVMFDEVPGFPKGHRVIANILTSVPRINIALGLPPQGVRHGARPLVARLHA